MAYLSIFLGSGLGGVLRYLISVAVQRLANGWLFPIGTFTVNLVGCMLIGFIAELNMTKGLFPGDQRLFLLVGLLGGFTTFSSFSFETVELLRDGQLWYAFCNVGLQVVLGLTCAWIGMVVGRLI